MSDSSFAALRREAERAWALAFGVRQMVMPVLDYDRYWELRHSSDTNPLGRDIVFVRAIDDGSSVLDIGCGTGRFLAYLLSVKKQIKAQGLDVSSKAVEVARGKGIECQVVDVTSPSFDLEQDYDYIVISDVLEHLPNPEALLLKLRGKFRKTLLISVPNIGYYPHRLRLLLGSFPIHTAWHPAEHLRYWTVTDFQEWLGHLGYRVEKVRASNGFPLLANLRPNLFGHQMVFIVGVSEGNFNSGRS
jgi:methionine biosynthesis protein MetW